MNPEEIDNKKAFFIILLFAIAGFSVIMISILNSDLGNEHNKNDSLFEEVINNTDVKKLLIQEEPLENINIQSFNQKIFNLHLNLSIQSMNNLVHI
jgi:hypothetical protein